MQAATKPVKANSLGSFGRDHVIDIAHWCGVSDDAKVEYVKETFEADDLPYVAEVAFVYFGVDEDRDDESLRRALVTGLNFSPTITDPFRDLGSGFSLDTLLAAQRADAEDPVFVFVHVASPRFVFVDKGKTAVTLPVRVAEGLAYMVIKATDKWRRQKEAEVRHATAALRRRDRLTRALADKPMSIKDAAYQVMPEAYAHAAGSVGMATDRSCTPPDRASCRSPARPVLTTNTSLKHSCPTTNVSALTRRLTGMSSMTTAAISASHTPSAESASAQ
jgi:hypothetical protein